MINKLCSNGHDKGSDQNCRWCKHSNKMKQRWKNERHLYMDSIDKITAGLKSKEAQTKREKYFSSNLHKSRARKQALELADDRRNGLKATPQNKISDTKPELRVEKILCNLNIKYQKQCPIGPYVFDFCLLDHNILIEVQGEYWHSRPNNIRNDLAKFNFVHKYYPKFKIHYIKEIDTKKSKQLYKLFNDLTGAKLKVRDFNFKDLDFKSVDSIEALQFLETFHYLPRFRKTIKATYGVFLEDKLIALTVFGLPSYNTVSKHYNLLGRQVLELSRFVINPNYQKKNLASWALSRSVKAVKNDFDEIYLLVTFADPHFGHEGVIYKAANWQIDGESRPGYYYQDSNGYIIHKKTLWDHAQKLRKTEKEYAIDNGYIKITSEPKKKFIKWIRTPPTQVKLKTSDLVETKCDCGAQNLIKNCNYKRALKKHGKYICHSCSLKLKWEQKEYRQRVNAGRKLGSSLPSKVEVCCNDCHNKRTIKRSSYRTSLNKHGYYLCHSCSLRKWHKDKKKSKVI